MMHVLLIALEVLGGLLAIAAIFVIAAYVLLTSGGNNPFQ